jgi:hypothetical protein
VDLAYSLETENRLQWQGDKLFESRSSGGLPSDLSANTNHFQIRLSVFQALAWTKFAVRARLSPS